METVSFLDSAAVWSFPCLVGRQGGTRDPARGGDDETRGTCDRWRKSGEYVYFSSCLVIERGTTGKRIQYVLNTNKGPKFKRKINPGGEKTKESKIASWLELCIIKKNEDASRVIFMRQSPAVHGMIGSHIPQKQCRHFGVQDNRRVWNLWFHLSYELASRKQHPLR